MSFGWKRQTIAPMDEARADVRMASNENVRTLPRRRRSGHTQQIGDVYLKRLSIKPREHWPQWVITKVAPNEDGIMHATLSLIGGEPATRQMSLATLNEQRDWELLKKAEEVDPSVR